MRPARLRRQAVDDRADLGHQVAVRELHPFGGPVVPDV